LALRAEDAILELAGQELAMRDAKRPTEGDGHGKDG